MDSFQIKIDERFSSLSIKEYLKINNVGKGKIEEIRTKYNVYINDEKKNLDYKLNINDILKFEFSEKIDVVPSFKEANVLYEDEHILIVNKESGILIHSDGNENDDTLDKQVAAYFINHKIFRNIRHVHRIDFETSGIVIYAKNFLAGAILNKMIETHDIERKYLALCQNKFNKKEGIINQNIARDRHVNNKYRVGNGSNSKNAITHYKVVKEMKGCSLVSLKLETGRTHQIRVHMSYLNHPLCGDILYGGNKNLINRVALHSASVKFFHPFTKELVYCECPLPEDFKI